MRITASNAAATMRGWRVGQVLDAVVREVSPDRATLQVGRATFTIRPQTALHTGEVLQLQVRSVRPEPMVAIVRPDSANPLAEGSRALLPRQVPVTQVLAELQTLLADPARQRILPEPVRTAASALLQSIPTSGQLGREDGLRQALGDSGIFLERKIAALGTGTGPVTALQGDVKGLLASFLNHVFRALSAQPRSGQGGEHPPPDINRPQPPPTATPRLTAGQDTAAVLSELARQADGALARMQLLQLSHLSQEGGSPWLFELPVRSGGELQLLQFMLERGPATEGGNGDKAWTVRLSFDFRPLGPLHCTVTLRGSEVTTSWWAERPGTASLVDAQLDVLAGSLNDLGLTVGGMRCVHGRPPGAELRPDRNEGGLVNERA